MANKAVGRAADESLAAMKSASLTQEACGGLAPSTLRAQERTQTKAMEGEAAAVKVEQFKQETKRQKTTASGAESSAGGGASSSRTERFVFTGQGTATTQPSWGTWTSGSTSSIVYSNDMG